jgi:hypothetical protein
MEGGDEVMRTLIIPDVHTKVSIADKIREAAGPVDETVFLGDYFDEWGDSPESNLQTGLWLRKTLAEPGVTMLLGNHDVNYAAKSQRCSGWTSDKQNVIEFFKSEIRSLRLWHVTQGWLLSHAGVGQKFVKSVSWNPANGDSEKACKTSFWYFLDTTGQHPITSVSGVSGGTRPFDGPLWHRPQSAWSGDKYLLTAQVFGHTVVKGGAPVLIGDSGDHIAICRDKVKPFKRKRVLLDTNLKHYAIITDGVLTVQEAPRDRILKGGI